ncbi:hypothetical protein AcV7_003960 [Taiwanofungus camphoratus]|nr:hypothetical protein AcV7_003960 [Antrodia cinnamomea]
MEIGPPCRQRIFESPQGKRKALIIGINYNTSQSLRNPEYPQLVGPHKDALDFRDLLIRRYGYQEAEVTIMLDVEGNVMMAPTRVNIIREIRKLVESAQAQDRFVFLYAGHSGQIVCREHSEDDSMDEVILPMDHSGIEDEAKLIVDNELRKLLVDPLPVGAQLTAIFDSCHSGTLLDLEHYACNGIYRPWVSKGQRSKRSRWLNIARQNAAVLDTSMTTLRVYQRPATGGPAVWTKALSLDNLASSMGQYRKTSRRRRTVPVPPQRTLTASSITNERGRMARRNTSTIIDRAADMFGLVAPRCMSPVSMQGRECTGFCEESPAEEPHVVSLAACNDTQMAWEDGNGVSMTQILIKLLDSKPHPTLRELMTFISYRLYDLSCRLHDYSRNKFRRARTKSNRNTDGAGADQEEPGEMVNFQDPQLGSRSKLNMDTTFTL